MKISKIILYNEPSVPEIDIRNIEKFILENGDIIVSKSSGSQHLIGKCCVFRQPNNAKNYLFSRVIKKKVYYLNKPKDFNLTSEFVEQSANNERLVRVLFGNRLYWFPEHAVEKIA